MFLKANFDEMREHTLLNKCIGGDNIIMVPSGDQWKVHRKIINPAFRRSSPIKLFGELTQELFKTMENLGETFDVSDLMM